MPDKIKLPNGVIWDNTKTPKEQKPEARKYLQEFLSIEFSDKGDFIKRTQKEELLGVSASDHPKVQTALEENPKYVIPKELRSSVIAKRKLMDVYENRKENLTLRISYEYDKKQNTIREYQKVISKKFTFKKL